MLRRLVVVSMAVWAVTVLLVGSAPARCREAGPFVLGPAEDTAVVEVSTADKQKLWRFNSGGNVIGTLEAGYELPGVGKDLLKVDAAKVDRADRRDGRNWLAIERQGLAPGAIPADTEGLHLRLATKTSAQWWISLAVVLANGESYSKVVADEVFPAGQLAELSVPLQDLKAGGKALRPDQFASIRRISIATSVPETPLYLGDISAYRRQKYYSWLEFTTSHADTNLFEPKDAVTLSFTLGGTRPKTAKGFRYEVRDFEGAIATQGVVRMTSAQTYSVKATPKTHGYYEVRAFFIDAAGKVIEKRSCIEAEGSVPCGLGTFSVLPSSVAQNIANFKKQGSAAFFGLHGDFLGLADAMGLGWRLGSVMWLWVEPWKPDRSQGGISDWASEQMASGPQPAYREQILPFRANMGSDVPEWARGTGNGTPAFADWDDYLGMVRDYVRVEKALYPHMHPRIYGCAWEINLNMPPYSSQSPAYTPDQVVELFRLMNQTIKAEDPEGIIIGPCPSVLDMAWYESVFKAGVLKYIDAIETHGYCEGAFTPEENDFPGKIAQLNELMRKYNGGKVLPIYCTEGGFAGVLGSQDAYRSQAQRMVREAIILKGEGIRVFLPFYGIDYDRSNMGFLFNKELEPNPWGTTRVSPKPMVNAVAACAGVLEGAKPVSRIRNLGDDVWAYVFEKPSATITAVWTTGATTSVTLPVTGTGRVNIIDIMGHLSQQVPVDGHISITVDASPQYLVVTR